MTKYVDYQETKGTVVFLQEQSFCCPSIPFLKQKQKGNPLKKSLFFIKKLTKVKRKTAKKEGAVFP